MLKRIFVFLLIILLLGILAYLLVENDKIISGNIVKTSEYKKETVFVSKVVDGDTIKDLSGNSYRLLGINTPEKAKPYYQEAKNFLIEGIENKSVEVLRDATDKDQYGRKLRYVFYDNRLINVEILEKGFATSFMLDSLIYENKLKTAENFAKENQIGLWERSSDICASCISLEKLEPIEDYFIIKNNCNHNCILAGWLVKDDANHFFKIDNLNAGDDKKYDSMIIFKKEVWNDKGDRFFMRDKNGKLVVFYEYVGNK